MLKDVQVMSLAPPPPQQTDTKCELLLNEAREGT